MFRLVYIFAYIGMWMVAILPFRLLYFLSDFLYLIVYHLVGYRKKVVRANLRGAYPDKTAQELKAIERKFYHYLCDYILENLKTLRMSTEEMHKRMQFIRVEEFVADVDLKGGAIVLMPHYACFEWMIGLAMYVPSHNVRMQVYKPIRNPFIDRLFIKIRTRFHGYNVPKPELAREVIKARKAGRNVALGMVADQSPNAKGLNMWVDFLNRKTPFLDGPERIARMMDFSVYYGDLERVKRGYGKVTFRLITRNPKEMPEGEITRAFARHIEATLEREPAYWFWSHKRWKHAYKAEEEHE